MSTPAVQEARKKMQLERLKRKGKKGYAEYYARQPIQIARARKNADFLLARNTLKAAAEALKVAEIIGVNLAATQEAHAIAALVVERIRPGKNGNAIAGLTGA